MRLGFLWGKNCMRFLFFCQFDTFGSADGHSIDGKNSLVIQKKYGHFS